MDQTVYRIAVSPGAGKSAIPAAIEKGADVLVTGDIGHHDGLDAVAQGLAVIDAGTLWNRVYLLWDDMKRFLADKLPGLEVDTAPVIHPFQVIP